MPIIRIKITDSKELLRKHYLCCDKRPLIYLEQVADQTAIKNAVDNGWLECIICGETFEYHITEKGKKLIYN